MSAPAETLRPPAPPGPIRWIRENLFNTWYNGIITIVTLILIILALSIAINWLLNIADWRPVKEYFLLFMVGQYPQELVWRVGLSLAIICLLFGISWGLGGELIQSFAITIASLLSLAALIPVQIDDLTIPVRLFLLVCVGLLYLGFIWGRKRPIRGLYLMIAWLIATVLIIMVLLPGLSNVEMLPEVPSTLWGGLLVTLILAVGGIVLSFPIGILLALGRRSSLPVVKGFCTAVIELIRGVPLVTILFMFSLILQVFLPVGSRFDRLLRALMAITIFSAAYMAENIRGGLAAVPPGQIEAAKAVGMNAFYVNLFIVLPQAIRAVIPAIVGQFIALFKDTTLVIILGINELLGIGRSVINADPEFIQLQLEVYLFIAAIFWIISYAMSYSSRKLEEALGVGER
jgi:general L-amino acid transport system permease protein